MKFAARRYVQHNEVHESAESAIIRKRRFQQRCERWLGPESKFVALKPRAPERVRDAERLAQGAQAFAVVQPVCDALQYAHEHGFVPRDRHGGSAFTPRAVSPLDQSSAATPHCSSGFAGEGTSLISRTTITGTIFLSSRR